MFAAPSRFHADGHEAGAGQNQEPGRLRRAPGKPARHRQRTFVGEVREVVLESLHGVERVFRQGESAGGGRCPGVDQGGLDDVESVVGSPNEATPLVCHNGDALMGVQIGALAGEAFAHDSLRDDRIDLDSRDVFRAGGQRIDDVRTTARSDDQSVTGAAVVKGVDQRTDISVPAALWNRIGTGDARGSAGVYLDVKLPVLEAFDGDARKSVPFLENRSTRLYTFDRRHTDHGNQLIANQQGHGDYHRPPGPACQWAVERGQPRRQRAQPRVV